MPTGWHTKPTYARYSAGMIQEIGATYTSTAKRSEGTQAKGGLEDADNGNNRIALGIRDDV